MQVIIILVVLVIGYPIGTLLIRRWIDPDGSFRALPFPTPLRWALISALLLIGFLLGFLASLLE